MYGTALVGASVATVKKIPRQLKVYRETTAPIDRSTNEGQKVTFQVEHLELTSLARVCSGPEFFPRLPRPRLNARLQKVSVSRMFSPSHRTAVAYNLIVFRRKGKLSES